MPVKSTLDRARLVVDGDGDHDALAVVHLAAVAAVAQPADRAAHAGFSVVLHVPHVGEQRREAVLAGGPLELAYATRVGGELRAQVGEVLVRDCVPGGRRRRAPRRNPASSRRPSRTMRTGSKSTPSSPMLRLPGGIEPGVMPPTSAWCARDAVKKWMLLPVSSKTGVTTVMSGRCVPPW